MDAQLKEAIQYVYERGTASADIRKIDVDGAVFSDKSLVEIRKNPLPVATPLAPVLIVGTLSALAAVVSNKLEELDPAKFFLHVKDATHVDLVAKKSDEHGRRYTAASAVYTPGEGFEFGDFHPPDEFAIALLTRFKQSEERDALVRLCGLVTNEKVVTAEDDGMSQKVGVRQGTWFKGDATLKPLTRLTPYRTFPDISQPESPFLTRAQSGTGGLPEMALFEADGGWWQREAMASIKTFLEAASLGVPVLS